MANIELRSVHRIFCSHAPVLRDVNPRVATDGRLAQVGTPLDLYRRPQNMNSVPGTVQAPCAATVTVRLQDGSTLDEVFDDQGPALKRAVASPGE